MDYSQHSDPSLAESSAKWLFGFFGAAAVFMLLPRTVKYLIKRFTFGVLGEVIAVAVAGLLAEKAAEKVSKHDRG